MTEACESQILKHLAVSDDASIKDTFYWAEEQGIDHNVVVGAVKSLLVDAYVSSEDLSSSFFVLTKEGEGIVSDGSQEIRVLVALNDGDAAGEGLTMPQLQEKVGKNICKIGLGNCMKNKWAKKQGDKVIALKSMDGMLDDTQADLQRIAKSGGKLDSVEDKAAAGLKRRKLISLVTRKSLMVSRGEFYSPERVKKAADLTKEMLDSGSWQTTAFKPYNFKTLGDRVGGGYLHPLLKVSRLQKMV
jgi:phenylalanyl-tRNA synthetase alpha chain